MPARRQMQVIEQWLADCELWRAFVETVGRKEAAEIQRIPVTPTGWAWYAGDGRGWCKGVG
jgi:hypothetical protein